MVTRISPPRRYAVNPVRPGREQRQRRIRVPGSSGCGLPPSNKLLKSYCARHLERMRCSKSSCTRLYTAVSALLCVQAVFARYAFQQPVIAGRVR